MRISLASPRHGKIKFAVAKAAAVFVVMFTVSFCLSEVELVDYPDFIENKRHHIALLSILGDRGHLRILAPEIAAICERECRKEWNDLEEGWGDFVELIAAICSCLFGMAMVERALVSTSRPFVRLEYRWLKESRFTGVAILGGMAMVFGLVYIAASTILSRLSANLTWPKLMTMAGKGTSDYATQFLSGWDQLLVCSKWLNVGFYFLGVLALLAIVVWGFANIRVYRDSKGS